MAWYWIDRFVEFRAGCRAAAVKNVSLAETFVRGHLPAHPVMPNSLILEGMGQTGMLLACEAIGYSQLVFLAKVSHARFFAEAVPGDTLTYTVTLHSISDGGVSATGTSLLGGRLQAEAELLYGRLDAETAGVRGDDMPAMVKMMRLLGAFSIGIAADGGPLRQPR